MQLQFLGANRQVTGSRTVVRVGGQTIMIDCGLFQERQHRERNWEPFVVDPKRLDVLLLTHAHLDHCGLIPKLVREGFTGEILATAPSIDLARIVLEDAAKIQEEDAAYKAKRHRREGRVGPHPEVPLYTAEDAARCFKQFRPVSYDSDITLSPLVTARFRDAGHILGSAMIELSVRESEAEAPVTILFSGDIGQYDAPLMHDPAAPDPADVIIMESTYGDRVQELPAAVDDRLAQVVRETAERGGKVVIPTFAIDRAQDLLFHFSELVRDERIPDIPIFLDSPMAVDVTDVFKRYMHLLDEHTQRMLDQGDHPFHFRTLQFVRTSAESRKINARRRPCIIMAGAGMCTGGRIKHHLVHNINRPESTILFVGYQADGTLGREIISGTSPVRILGKHHEVHARIERIEGLSAHADRDGLLRWLGSMSSSPKRVFLNHGEESGALALAEAVQEQFRCQVHVPQYGAEFDLASA